MESWGWRARGLTRGRESPRLRLRLHRSGPAGQPAAVQSAKVDKAGGRRREAADRRGSRIQSGTIPSKTLEELLGEWTMSGDYIIQEVRTIREQLAAQHAYDVRALFAAARERQQESERKVVKLAPRPLEAVSSSA